MLSTANSYSNWNVLFPYAFPKKNWCLTFTLRQRSLFISFNCYCHTKYIRTFCHTWIHGNFVQNQNERKGKIVPSILFIALTSTLGLATYTTHTHTRHSYHSNFSHRLIIQPPEILSEINSLIVFRSVFRLVHRFKLHNFRCLDVVEDDVPHTLNKHK